MRDFFNNKNISNYKFNLQYLFCGSKEGLIYMAYIIKGKFAKNTKMGYINSVLVIACFSSVIFDFLFIKKPYIIFIPDSEDLDWWNIYSKSYWIIFICLNASKKFNNESFQKIAKMLIISAIYYFYISIIRWISSSSNIAK